MFSILKPFLFNLDPEAAHDLAIKSLKYNLLPSKMFSVKDLMNESDIGDVLLTGGGIIPEEDMNSLEAYGVGRLFGPGTTVNSTIEYINQWYEENREKKNE